MKKSLVIFILLIMVIIGAFVLRKINIPKQNMDSRPVLAIGVSLPLTGSIAHFGESAKNGLELAYSQLGNQNPNYNLKYYIQDNAFDAKTAVSAYQQLKDTDNIDALITASSPATLASEPLAKQENILQMGIFASTPSYSSPNDLSFRVFPRAEKEAGALVDYLTKTKVDRLAVIYINNDFGKGVDDSLKAALANRNSLVKMVSEENYLPGSFDFRTSITKIKSAGPQAIIMVATAQDAVSILRQSQEEGLKADFLATSSASDPAVLGQSPQYTNGLKITDLFDPESQNKEVQEFVNSYKQKFGQEPDMYAAQGYDGFKFTAMALLKCGKDSECIKSYLMALDNYPSILGNLKFDINGDPDYGYYIKVFQDGQFHRLE